MARARSSHAATRAAIESWAGDVQLAEDGTQNDRVVPVSPQGRSAVQTTPMLLDPAGGLLHDDSRLQSGQERFRFRQGETKVSGLQLTAFEARYLLDVLITVNRHPNRNRHLRIEAIGIRAVLRSQAVNGQS